MTTSGAAPFVPVLTVMVDYGNAPFLWLVKRLDEGGVGGNHCDGTFWEESLPMSEGLWRKFAHWPIEFDRTAFYAQTFDDTDWDWIAFHTRGLQLSRWLKDEVGDAYRVVYQKPSEDPNHRIEGRTEVLPDGELMVLPALRGAPDSPAGICRHIVSGGQTGADRAALDFAILHGYTHGGWVPQGREAEDCPLPLKYQLIEVADGGYRQRTRRNVEDGDGTLIVNLGEMDGGSLVTLGFARQLGKPHLVVQIDAGVSAETVAGVLAWLREHRIEKLNIAGPRESKRPGIGRLTGELLEAVEAALRAA